METKELTHYKNLVEKLPLLKKEISKIIIGQHEAINEILIALLAGGHCLLEGVPGLAKTLMVKTMAETLEMSFKRMQFTPDLMPGDIIGTEILEEDHETGKKFFKFNRGPIFANIVLADEINRTPPKTQAALLEAMQEHSVTAAGQKYILDKPFFVLATQNPIEQEGTYPLPEAQLDRFMFSIWLDYPKFEDELTIVRNTTSDFSTHLNEIISKEEIRYFQDLVLKVPVNESVLKYAVGLSAKTRPNTELAAPISNKYLKWGAGPRASQYLVLGAKTLAALQGKYSPDIDDIKKVAVSILRHRVIKNYKAEAENLSVEDIIEELMK